MLHVLDFNGRIIDFISDKDNYLIRAEMNKNKEDNTETFDFTIDSDRAEFMRERNRVVVKDSSGLYREYIIVHVDDTVEDLTEVQCNASYLEDIGTAKPIPPGKYDAMTTTQALKEALKDTGWECSPRTEYGGARSTSWTAYNRPYDIVMQLCTTYNMEADFYIELDSNKVAHRYVTLREHKPLFKGKEITYGKDLIGMTRTVDLTELHTALMALGPEDEEGHREIVTVTDDAAQKQFGLDKRYIWGIYEPQSEDTTMTKQRLTTLATTQLNKDKQAVVSYEITTTDLTKLFPHEKITLGDIVRVKDREFNPPLYVEAEVITEVYNPIAKESTYTFGQVKEFKESELRKDFNNQLNAIRALLNDKISNLNTIISETEAGNLEVFERKIIKSDTPPPNPVNDTLWYDTSNPNVAVLRRYFNGEWIEQTVSDVEQIGGITREKALYSELDNTFINLSIQHSRLLEEVYELLNNEYLVDNQLKQEVNDKLNATINVFNNIKSNLDGMTPETATIGRLIDTQQLFLTYREAMQDLYNSVEKAKIAADKRFKLLQSQYTDAKFNDAMTKVAESIGGTWNSDTQQLIANIPSRDEMQNAIKEYTDGKTEALQQMIGEQTDSKIKTAKDELSSSITSTNNKIDGITIGGRNLLKDTDVCVNKSYQSFVPTVTTLEVGQTYTASIDIELVNGAPASQQRIGGELKIFNADGTTAFVNVWLPVTKAGTNYKGRLTGTFTVAKEVQSLGNFSAYSNLVSADKAIICRPKIEKANKATDWTPAPEDVQNSISKAQADATAAAKEYADNAIKPITTTQIQQSTDIKQLKDSITLKADKSEITTMYDTNIKPLQTQVNTQQAQLDVLPSQINAKVSKSDYTTDQNNIVTRLNTADTQRQQLSNAINDRVTLTEFNDVKVGTRNLLMNGGYNAGMSYWRNVGKATPANAIDTSQTGLPSDLKNVAIIELDDYANNEKGIAQDGLNLTVGKEYILSAWIKVITGGPIVRLQEGKTKFTNKNFNATAEWQRYEYKFTASEQPTNVYIIIPKGTANAKIAVTGVQLVEGNKNTDFKLSDKDTDKTLTTMQTQINQNGTDINLRATKDEFNATNKTLSKAIADFAMNTTTGLTFTYDNNGTIQSSNIGPDGVKIKGDRVDITVNQDFKVMTSNVNNKVGKNEVVNSINVSNEGINIDANKVGLRGGDGTTYMEIKNTRFLSRGFFSRTWGGVTDKPYCKLGIYDGYMIMQNETSGRNLYMTEKGLSTTMSGDLDSTSGTLQFHFDGIDPKAPGVRLHSYYGVVYIQSQYNRVFLRSAQTSNIETWDASIYLRPYLGTRSGMNEFAFKTVEASEMLDQDGMLVYGEISDPSGLAGSGLRFKKNGVKGYADRESIVYATDNAGNANEGSFSGKFMYGHVKTRVTDLYIMSNSAGEIKATGLNGYQGDSTVYVPIRSLRFASQSVLGFTNHSNGGTYFGVGADAGNKLYVTDNNGFNNGKPQWRPVVASAFTNGSRVEYKKDIKAWQGDALETINDTDLYTFQYRDSHDDRIHHGVIIGEDYDTPEAFIQDEGVNLYDMITYSMRAIQQLSDEVKSLKAKNNELEAKINE